MAAETSASGLSALLQQVTQRKLDNLVVQRDRHATKQHDALREASTKADAVESVTALIDAIEDKLIERQADELSECPLALMKHFLKQATYDPSITADMVSVWRAQLERSMTVFQSKLDSSILFSQLVADWAKSATGDAAEPPSRAAAQEQRAEWESFAFSECTTDKTAIQAYLSAVFAKRHDEDDDDDEEDKVRPGKKVKKSPLEELREDVEIHEDCGFNMTTPDVEEAIKSVLASDLFAGAKHAALKNLLGRPEVLREICDILNQDLQALEHWQWASSPMDMYVRRHVNGKYRVYLDEELYQAIFLDYIGTNWARHFRGALHKLYYDGLWKHESANGLTRAEKSRRKGMMAGEVLSRTIRSKRMAQYYQLWLVNLKEVGGYDDDGDSNTHPTDVKQSLLRLITTEASIQQGLGREFTLLQSDFRWFGPSLPHSTIEAVLEFFGMSKRWIGFFRTFLTPTLRFRADGDVPGRARTCGVPMSHIISTMLGELLLATLDFAVNRATKGGYLYRNHDDIWFFGTHERCTQAWEALQHFTSTMGLALNQDKTAAVTLPPRTPDDQHFVTVSMAKESDASDGAAGLPWGTVRWGFLYMDAETRNWEMDEAQLVEHAKEFKLQLAATTSVMAWIRVWNRYLTGFFVNNFGKTSLCLGHRHTEICQRAFAIVQKTVFDGSDAAQANVAAYLRAALQKTYGAASTDNFVDGALYFPRGVGGLEVNNPLVELTMELQAEYDDVDVLVREAMQDTRAAYKLARQSYEERGAYTARDTFMSWEEYALRSPDDTNAYLGVLYGRLTEGAEKGKQEDDVAPAEQMTIARFNLARLSTLKSVVQAGAGGKLSAYWTRILELYGNEVVRKYGSLVMCEPKDLPLGLVNFVMSEKVRWQP